MLAGLAVTVAAWSGCQSPPAGVATVSSELQRRAGASFVVSNPPPGSAWIPAGVSIDDGVSEDEAVLVALWNNSAFQELLADLGLARANVIHAGMLPNPTVSMLVPSGTKPLELTAKYPLEILWLRPRRVQSARLEYERTAQRLVQSGLDLIRDVRLAYADASLAQERLRLGRLNLDLSARISNLSTARLRAGDASELETSAAEIDTLQAEEQLERWQHEARIALARLQSLAGSAFVGGPSNLSPSELPTVDPPVVLCLSNALSTRPDLHAAALGVEAEGKKIGLARAEAFTIAGLLDVNEDKPRWLIGPGVDLAVPILNQNQGGVAQARARLEKASRQYFTVRDRLLLEVRESHARLLQARQSQRMWRDKILPPLEGSVRDADKAFTAGNVSYLFVLETNRRLLDARLKAATAESDVRRALAELDRSIGRRARDLTEPSPP